MSDSPASYIHTVHHLIEECMVFNMSKEECMEALFKHANIKPVITATVWKELEKENKEFFEAYEKRIREKNRVWDGDRAKDPETMISDSSQRNRNGF